MDYKRIISNISTAFIAQGLSLLLSMMLSLLVPKILGVEEFGYWQLFLFYSSFCGLFHFGLNDGIYLLHGGTPYSELDYRAIGSQLKLGAIVQSMLSLCFVCCVALLSPEANRLFVLTAVAIYLPVNNAAYFIGFIFQASNETKLFSISVILDKLLFIAVAIILIVGKETSFQPYVISCLVARFAALTYCCIKGREVVLAKSLPIAKAITESRNSIAVGIKLTLANVASLLIIGSMRFIVDANWGIETFSQLSLAISLQNFFIVFIQQVSMVLFPALRQADEKEKKKLYSLLNDCMTLMMPFVYILFFPIVLVLNAWLPQYSDAFMFFGLLLPISVFDARMNVISITYFKVLRMEKTLLVLNAGAVVISVFCSAVSVFVFSSIDLMIAGVTLSVVLRSIVSEHVVSKSLGGRSITRSAISTLCASLVFIFTNCTLGFAGALFANICCYILILLANKETASSAVMSYKDLKNGAVKPE